MSRPKAEYPQKQILLTCLTFLAVFLLIAIFRSSFHSVDIAVNTWMPSIQSEAFTVFAKGIDDYFDTNFLIIYSVVIAATFFVKHRKQNGLLLVGAMAGAALLVSIVKRVELIPRPDNAIVLNNGYSFPSGHAVGIVVLGGVLAYFAWNYWESMPVRVGIAGVCGVAVGVVSFDRVYLNTHWFSDVLGSLLLGAFWLSFVILLYMWLECQGSFQGKRFNAIANWLYVAAVLAVLVVVSGAVV
jgi:undecaprenyl-diphosphatase